jgi:hypothetical protein
MTDDEIIAMWKQTDLPGWSKAVIAFARLIAKKQMEIDAHIAEDWDSDSADPRDVGAAILAQED